MATPVNLRNANPRPASFTRRPRVGGVTVIDQFHIHWTGGPTTLEKQGQAMENWFSNAREWPNGNKHTNADGSAWGGSAEFGVVLTPDGADVETIQFGDWINTWSSFSAGYGNESFRHDYAAATRGIAIEIAHTGNPNERYDGRLIDATARLCAWLNDVIVSQGGQRIPLTRIAHWDQDLDSPVPRGFIGHMDLENGRRLRKPDPGAIFPWTEFIILVDKYQSESNVVVPAPVVLSKPRTLMDLVVDGFVKRKKISVRNLEQEDGHDRYLVEYE